MENLSELIHELTTKEVALPQESKKKLKEKKVTVPRRPVPKINKDIRTIDFELLYAPSPKFRLKLMPAIPIEDSDHGPNLFVERDDTTVGDRQNSSLTALNFDESVKYNRLKIKRPKGASFDRECDGRQGVSYIYKTGELYTEYNPSFFDLIFPAAIEEKDMTGTGTMLGESFEGNKCTYLENIKNGLLSLKLKGCKDAYLAWVKEREDRRNLETMVERKKRKGAKVIAGSRKKCKGLPRKKYPRKRTRVLSNTEKRTVLPQEEEQVSLTTTTPPYNCYGDPSPLAADEVCPFDVIGIEPVDAKVQESPLKSLNPVPMESAKSETGANRGSRRKGKKFPEKREKEKSMSFQWQYRRENPKKVADSHGTPCDNDISSLLKSKLSLRSLRKRKAFPGRDANDEDVRSPIRNRLTTSEGNPRQCTKGIEKVANEVDNKQWEKQMKSVKETLRKRQEERTKKDQERREQAEMRRRDNIEQMEARNRMRSEKFRKVERNERDPVSKLEEEKIRRENHVKALAELERGTQRLRNEKQAQTLAAELAEWNRWEEERERARERERIREEERHAERMAAELENWDQMIRERVREEQLKVEEARRHRPVEFRQNKMVMIKEGRRTKITAKETGGPDVDQDVLQIHAESEYLDPPDI